MENILGKKVKDKITGLTGIATAKCLYINGCDHIGIQAPAKDGRIPAIQWVDEPQIQVLGVKSKTTKKVKKKAVRKRGGPADHPGRRGGPIELHDDIGR